MDIVDRQVIQVHHQLVVGKGKRSPRVQQLEIGLLSMRLMVMGTGVVIMDKEYQGLGVLRLFVVQLQ
jgi:hypothetical protein